MAESKKLQNEPYMLEIKKLFKNQAYFREIQDAVDNEDEELIESLLQKYLRKGEAEHYFPQIVWGLRRLKLVKSRIEVEEEEEVWSKPTIFNYLKDRLEKANFEEIKAYIEDSNADSCSQACKDYLRYQEAEEIMPHIYKLMKVQYFKKEKEKDRVEGIKKKAGLGLILMSQDEKNEKFLLKDEKSRKKLLISSSKKINPQQFFEVLQEKLPKKFIQQVEEQPWIKSLNKGPFLIKELKSGREQRQKRQLLKQIQTVINNKETYEEVEKLLKSGKLKKTEQIIKQEIGGKKTTQLMKKIEQIFEQIPNAPIPHAIFLKNNEDGIKFYEVQTQQILHDIPEDEISNVLMVGMTGVGKSTFLNSLVNYFLQVEMEDNFRYIVSRDMFKNGDGKSSTDKVCLYGLPKQGNMKKAVRLIDIPGLGDTGGVAKDDLNLQMIKSRIEKTVPFVNLIIYVFKASDTRITKEAEYVISKVMGMFAKDMEASIMFVLTFADNDEPRVLAPLKATFSSLIQKKISDGKDWYLKVNNSALLKKIGNDAIDKCFYTMGQKCLEKVSDLVFATQKISTQNSVLVMGKREQLTSKIRALNQIIQASLTQQEEIRKTITHIADLETKIKTYNYKFMVKQQKIQFIATPNNVTSCLNCKFSCHSKCAYGKNQQKIKCVAIQNGFCKICPNKCKWQAHINEHQIVKRVFVDVEKTNEELYKLYGIESSNKDKNIESLYSLISDYSGIMMNIENYCQELKLLNTELQSLELRKVNYATIIDYVQMMIDNEEGTKSTGYQERIKEFKKFKKEQERLSKLLTKNQDEDYEKFEKQMATTIKNLVGHKQLADKIIEKVLKSYEKIRIFKADVQYIKDNYVKKA